LFKIGIETAITNHFPHNIAVFLFDKTVVVFAIRSAAGELDMVLSAPGQELFVNELTAVITVGGNIVAEPRRGKGRLPATRAIVSLTQRWARLRRAYTSVQPEYTPVMVMVTQNSTLQTPKAAPKSVQIAKF
jgi:hypothetical protein